MKHEKSMFVIDVHEYEIPYLFDFFSTNYGNCIDKYEITLYAPYDVAVEKWAHVKVSFFSHECIDTLREKIDLYLDVIRG